MAKLILENCNAMFGGMPVLPFRRSTTVMQLMVLAVVVGVCQIGYAQEAGKIQPPASQPGEKELYLPARINSVPANNDFTDPNSEFNYKRMVVAPDLVLFWDKEYGDDPTKNTGSRQFDPQFAVKECERFFQDYVDKLKFVQRGHSLTDKYKFLVFVISNSKGGTAFGGGEDDKIGCLWTPATRIAKTPYGVIAHELGHSFQYMVHADGGNGLSGGSIHEMTSQYQLWQEFPEWMTFENYHLQGGSSNFMAQTNLAFLHEANQYHSPYVLEYWSNKHGVDFIGKMWREANRGEDTVQTYKRLAGLNQEQFNDEMFDACRRFITWDMPRVEQVAHRYANQHFTSMTAAADGWYEIAKNKCPQNYGYNGIKLTVPPAGTKVTLNFKGIAGEDGFHAVHLDKAGWRYGFLASKKDGSRDYGDMSSAAEGNAEFTVPANTEFLWLVVMGAPTDHWQHVSPRRGGQNAVPGSGPDEEQWPYKIKLTGADLDPLVLHAPKGGPNELLQPSRGR